MKRRVVVTGLGVISPIGCTVEEFRSNLLAGVSGVGALTLFDPAHLPTRIAAEVKVAPGVPVYRDRKVSFAQWAAQQAMTSAGLTNEDGDPTHGRPGGGLSLALGLELFSMEDAVAMSGAEAGMPASLRERLTRLQTPSDLCVHMITSRYGLIEPPLTHVSACAAGTDAIGYAYRAVAEGRRGWMLAGGTDSMINPLGVAGFCKIGATSTTNERPREASRPFDRRRDGFVLGEGAAILVLETLDDARRRGATIHAEIIGFGNSFDADEISRPHPNGRGAYQAMQRALDDAGVGPAVIDCVNAHGTSTPLNDMVETIALKRLLGERARQVPVCAPKSMFGHLIAAAGAVEAAAAIVCLETGHVHPTINLEEPDPACDLDYVPGVSRRHEQRYVLSNSFGFGGQNSCLLMRRYDADAT